MSKQKVIRAEVARAKTPDIVSKMVSGVASSRSEGHSIAFEHVDATGRVGLDVSKAPIPSRRYAAEMCSVDFIGKDMRMIFAQRAVFGDDIETALVIRLSPTAVLQFAESMREMTSPTLAEIAQLTKVEQEPLSNVTSRPHQTVKAVANLVSIAIAGHETCVDFYHASAFAVRKAENQNKLEVEPVVRVDMSTGLFLSLNDHLQAIASELAISYN